MHHRQVFCLWCCCVCVDGARSAVTTFTALATLATLSALTTFAAWTLARWCGAVVQLQVGRSRTIHHWRIALLVVALTTVARFAAAFAFTAFVATLVVVALAVAFTAVAIVAALGALCVTTVFTVVAAFAAIAGWTAFGIALVAATIAALVTTFGCGRCVASSFAIAVTAAIAATFTAAVTVSVAIAITATAAAFVATAVTAWFAGFRGRCGYRCSDHWGGCLCTWAEAEQALEPGDEAHFRLANRRGGSRCWCGRSGSGASTWLLAGSGAGSRTSGGVGTRLDLWRWRVWQHTLDDRGLLVGGLLRATGHLGLVFGDFGELVAGLQVFQTRVVVLQAFELVVRRFERLVRNHQHVDALLEFDLRDFGALLVEQERGHFHGHLAVHCGGVVLHGLFLDDAQNLQRRAFRVTDVAGAAATWAVDVRAFGEGGLQTLAAHFHEAELADGAELHTGAVLAQRVAQAVFHFAAVLRLFHVDEVDDDQATQVTQTHLARDFVGSFQIGAGRGFFDVAALDGAGRVHVDRNQGFGVVDHHGAAGRQGHHAGIGGFDLVFDLEAAEQRSVIAVALDLVRMLGHHVRHELMRLVEDVVRVDQDVADVAVEVVADRADHEARFLIDQECALARLGRAVDGGPQLEQVVQVPLQFGRSAANASGARDDGHTLGVFQLVHRFFELCTVFTLDAAGYATTTGVVGHQNHIAAGQTDEGGEGCALVATFFFFDLNQQLLAFPDHVLDLGLAGRDAFCEVLLRDFLEWQETVAVFTVVHKAGFQRGLYTGNDRFVDVALALFAAFDFDLVVQQLLAVDDGEAAFFGLRGIDKHPFHDAFPSRCCVGAAPCSLAGRRLSIVP